MMTVPAQIFCEPRAAFTAAARSMPGVWAVLLSSRSLLMTLTPSMRQSRFGVSIASTPCAPGSPGKRLDQHVPVDQSIVELFDPDSLIETVREFFAVHHEDHTHAVGGYAGVAVHGAVG